MDLSSLKSLIAKMETKSSLGLFFILILSLGIFILSYLFEEVLENSSSHSQWHYTERQTNNIVVQRKGRISISLLWEGLRRTALYSQRRPEWREGFGVLCLLVYCGQTFNGVCPMEIACACKMGLLNERRDGKHLIK
jgi:hypothetical protein